MTAYYNEFNAEAAHVLRQLIAEDVITPGDVDERSIKDVSPDDLRGYTQCHFFAGGGLWSVAARLAGWPDSRPLWTGSCPCQPFSQAGKRAGTDDPRHLWPDFHRLISAARPAIVMGEQVAGKAGRHWFDGVRADLEACGFAARAVDVPACAVDAPHERNRLWWVAVADADESRCAGARLHASAGQGVPLPAGSDGRPEARGRCHVADADRSGLAFRVGERRNHGAQRSALERAHGRNGSWWADAEWIICHDGKARRAKPGISMLVDGLPGRVGLWRIAGNAISPILAAEIIGAFLDTEVDERLRLTGGIFD